MLGRLFSIIFAGLLLSPATFAQSEGDRGSYGIEWGTGRIICTGDSDAQPQQYEDPSYARAAAWDRRMRAQLGNICASELTPLDGGTWGRSEPFSGADAAGLEAEFRLYVLHDRFTWKLGSASEITDNNQPADLTTILTTPEFGAAFCSANAAFSMGAASHEGPTEPNHRLAASRADTVVSHLTDARADCPVGQIPILFAVSLGEHQNTSGCTSGGDCAGNTGPQRRVIIVAAEDITLGVNLREALLAAIEGQNVFSDFSVSDYDLFEITSF